MRWILQDNLFNEDANERLLDVLTRADLAYDLVKVIPFGGGIEPDIKVNEPAVVIGSVSLVKHAKKCGWVPGGWINDDFNYRAYVNAYGDRMLNFGCAFTKFSEVATAFGDSDLKFIRPVSDGKEFGGKVFTRAEFEAWAKLIGKGTGYWTITDNTEVLVADPTIIYSEYRCVVVDSKVVTASMYKRGSRVVYETCIDDSVVAFAQAAASDWTPDRVFVLDVAATPDGYKIVEINCFNSAGLYACDVSAIVQAIERMEY